MRFALRKLWQLLDAPARRGAALLFSVYLVNALLQVVGIASVMPFMALAMNPDLVFQNHWLKGIHDALGFSDANRFLVFSGFAFLVLMTLANAAAAFSTHLTLRFTYDQSHRLAVRLLEAYAGQPYAFFLRHNTAALAKNLLSDCTRIASGVLAPMATVLARLLVTLLTVGLLLYVEPLLTIVSAGVLGGAYAVIYVALHRMLGRIGRESRQADARRHQGASEALSGIKEARILQAESFFVDRFATPSADLARLTARGLAVAQMPRYLLETVAFGGVVAITLYLLVTRGDASAALPTLGLYAVAAYRLMPALQQLFAAASNLRFHWSTARALADELAQAPPPAAITARPAAPLGLSHAVELRGLRFSHEGAAQDALRDISLQVPLNASIALVGPTGSGKSTLVDIILGLLSPQQGQILVDGTPVTPANLRAWQRNLGYVPQQIYLTDDTVARNIAFGVPDDQLDMAAVERAARIAHIHDFIVGELPKGYETVVGERGVRLSGGQRQRIGIARALYRDPEVLVLDEATSALDNATEEVVMEAIRGLAHRKTMIMIAHRLTTVRDCDVIYLLEQGRVVAQGSYDELLASSERFRELARADA